MDFSDQRRWQSTHAQSKYQNPWIEVVEHQVLDPNGNPGLYGVVKIAHWAVGILPLDSEGRVGLVGQHRFPRDYYSWELPEGGGKMDQDPQHAAERELKEEMGVTAAGWAPLLCMDLSNAITDERAYGFLAWNLSHGAPEPEASEAISLQWLPFGEVHRLAYQGEIKDAFAQTMIFKAEIAFRQGDLPADAAAAVARGLAV
jgi:8-oxo-dGTP pyrophosphatase MutT (NUDIX family)